MGFSSQVIMPHMLQKQLQSDQGFFSHHFLHQVYSKSERTAQGCNKVVTVSIAKLFQASDKVVTGLPVATLSLLYG